jgi:membrane protein involved in colicin uptake
MDIANILSDPLLALGLPLALFFLSMFVAGLIASRTAEIEEEAKKAREEREEQEAKERQQRQEAERQRREDERRAREAERRQREKEREAFWAARAARAPGQEAAVAHSAPTAPTKPAVNPAASPPRSTASANALAAEAFIYEADADDHPWDDAVYDGLHVDILLPVTGRRGSAGASRKTARPRGRGMSGSARSPSGGADFINPASPLYDHAQGHGLQGELFGAGR